MLIDFGLPSISKNAYCCPTNFLSREIYTSTVNYCITDNRTTFNQTEKAIGSSDL